MFCRRMDLSWPILCILVCLFILSVRLPKGWERIARDEPLPAAQLPAIPPQIAKLPPPPEIREQAPASDEGFRRAEPAARIASRPIDEVKPSQPEEPVLVVPTPVPLPTDKVAQAPSPKSEVLAPIALVPVKDESIALAPVDVEPVAKSAVGEAIAEKPSHEDNVADALPRELDEEIAVEPPTQDMIAQEPAAEEKIAKTTAPKDKIAEAKPANPKSMGEASVGDRVVLLPASDHGAGATPAQETPLLARSTSSPSSLTPMLESKADTRSELSYPNTGMPSLRVISPEPDPAAIAEPQQASKEKKGEVEKKVVQKQPKGEEPNWQEPEALLTRLDRLASHEATRSWASEAARWTRKLGPAMSSGSQETAAILARLERLSDESPALVASIRDKSLAQDMSRAGHSLDRRGRRVEADSRDGRLGSAKRPGSFRRSPSRSPFVWPRSTR